MDQELKSKWVAALRSGEYQQAIGVMRDFKRGHVEHCCLSVLLCISGQCQPAELTGHGHDANYRRAELMLGSRETRLLMQRMNDLDRKSFADIADYVEATL